MHCCPLTLYCKWPCLAWLNKVLIKPVHMGLTLNDILPRLAGVKYLTHIDANSVHHNFKLEGQSSYLTSSSCSFGRYIYVWLPFVMAPAGNMFQRKIDKLFWGLPKMFGIVDNILIACFNYMGRDHDATLKKALRIFRQAKLKLN